MSQGLRLRRPWAVLCDPVGVGSGRSVPGVALIEVHPVFLADPPQFFLERYGSVMLLLRPIYSTTASAWDALTEKVP